MNEGRLKWRDKKRYPAHQTYYLRSKINREYSGPLDILYITQRIDINLFINEIDNHSINHLVLSLNVTA